jgi:rRNA maturation RNase YbeY
LEEERITFEFESTPGFSIEETLIKDWLEGVVNKESKILSNLSFTICSDEFLLQINKEHLNHDFYTDIITFPYSYEPIESDIYISIDRVEDNAKAFSVSTKQEFARVLVHGVLHMCGYDDHSEEDKKLMREKEDHYLASLVWA